MKTTKKQIRSEMHSKKVRLYFKNFERDTDENVLITSDGETERIGFAHTKDEFIDVVYNYLNREDENVNPSTLINWSELSRIVTKGDRNGIRANNIPQKHREKVDKLIKAIKDWATEAGI